jgi:hypothetical protein
VVGVQKELVVEYMVLIYADENSFAGFSAVELQEVMTAYGSYSAALVDAGVLRAGHQLQPSGTATTVSVRDGQRSLTSGSLAEGREQLGGYYLLECETLDQALDWAARCPGAIQGSVEVRPVVPSQE